VGKSSKIARSAKDEDCQIRIGGVCNFNSETTVFCHVGGAGMGRKSNDIHGAYGCSSCHAAVDGGLKTKYSKQELIIWFYNAVIRTQLILIEKGLIYT
jgi:hypothetical protein